jgi:hypothetical protein
MERGLSMRRIIGIAIVAVTCGSTHAQQPDQSLHLMLGTLSVEVTPNFAGGRLEGCSISFKTLTQDWIYKQGAYAAVSGGFGVTNIKRDLRYLSQSYRA